MDDGTLGFVAAVFAVMLGLAGIVLPSGNGDGDDHSYNIFGAGYCQYFSSSSATRYCSLLGFQGWHTLETYVTQPFFIGTFLALRVYVVSNTFNGNFNVTLRVNGADTELSVLYGAGETGVKTCIGEVAIQNLDMVCVRATEFSSSGIIYPSVGAYFDVG